MKPWIVIVVAFAAVSALGQAAFDTHIRIERADGTEVLIPTVEPVTDAMIVEFREPPLAVAAARAGKSAMADYRATFTRFRGDLTAIVNLNRAGKSAIAPEVRWEYFEVFNGASVRLPRQAVAAIARLPYVKRVHPDHEMHTMAGAAVGQIGADKVWSQLGSRGKGVVVAVIDTGIDYTHEALGGQIGPAFKVLGGYDFVNKDTDPFDDNGHGTHVAGIIAGDSPTITGVAPEASLMAFKVLGAFGSGSESNVIAAIERAADPNGDGDFSDHIDVANLSLGGTGGPDDPGSRAIDNATQAGVVFCIAAGNSGKYHNVSSPGTARSAITVGAVDSSDQVASFSSRGPTPKDLTMKPEIGAPGVNILSSLPGNRYGNASGTSMATPHVAGACALLKALHRDWTPARIKMAIMVNATVTGQETMSSGSGRLDVLHASTGPLSIDMPSIDFGLDPIKDPAWSPSRTFHVTNRSEQDVTYTVQSSAGSGFTAAVLPETLTLAAGASAEVTLSVDIDNDSTPVNPKSYSGGGVISFTNPSGTVHVPWTFVKAVRAIVTWDKEFATVLWLDAGRTLFFESTAIDSNASEALFAAPGNYDVVVFGSTLNPDASALVRANFIYLEGQRIEGDLTIATTEAQASHVIRGATTAPDGKVLQSGSDQTYALSGRLVWPAGTSTLRSLAIPPLPLHELRVNDIGDSNTILVNETYVDFRGNSLYAIQHGPLKGVNANTTLAAGNMKSADLRLLIPPATRGDAKIVVQVLPTARAGDNVPGVTITHPLAETVWSGRVSLTPDADPNYSAGISFVVSGDGNTWYQTPALRVTDGAVTTNTSPVPWLYSGDLFLFGSGPRFATATFTNVTTALRPSLFVDFFGPLGETRLSERTRTSVATFGSDGKLLRRAVAYPASLDFSIKGRYTVEATNDATQFPDLALQTILTIKVNSLQADYIPPTLTTLFIVDGNGRATREIDPHGAASLYFSAADYTYPTKAYQPVRSEGTAVWYRYAGAAAWTPLPVTQMAEDAGVEGRLGGGVLYRVDLSSVANVNWARVDLKIDLADNAGNTTSLVMQPALSVGSEYPARRRAAR